MKARVKATGEIVEVSPYWTEIHTTNGGCYEMTEVELMPDDPDYWTRLEHQYAGMAMQGILSNPESELDYGGDETLPQALAGCVAKIAHALVEKMKEKEEK
jgi:hypothetical protein